MRFKTKTGISADKMASEHVIELENYYKKSTE